MSAADLLRPLFIRVVPDQPLYESRIQEEFALIDKNRFTRVFLQVRRILQLTVGIPHIIRGSAGSSLVCFLLGITHIDPIKHGLELARFMNSKRADMPDIDMDFPYNRRAEVFEMISKEWPTQIGRVSNHIHWHYKSALRQAARETGVPAASLAKGWRLDKVVADPKERAAIQARASALCGTVRTHSLHCGGVVIFEEEDEVPTELIMKAGPQGSMQLTLDKDETEAAGLIKIDVLSNRGLAVLADLSDTSLTDYPSKSAAITELFRSGQNIGITFAESRGMRKVLAVMAPVNVTEVAMALALIRPAASENGHKRLFLEAWRLLPGTWTPDATDNRILFDDDAIDTIRSIINCSDGEADAWRRSFAKGKKHQEPEFARLMDRAGYDPRVVLTTIENLQQLQLYSFCKSHALSYAQLVWALAYWKLTTPHEFWTAVLNHSHSEYRSWVHKREARSCGLLLSRAKPPYALGSRRGVPALVPATGSEQPVLLPDDNRKQMLADLRQQGVWFGPAFLPGCGLRDRQMLIDKKDCYRVRFSGPIASGRLTDSTGSTITVICVGVGNQQYVDLVVEGKRNDLLSYFAVSGTGIGSKRGCIETINVERISGLSMVALLNPTRPA